MGLALESKGTNLEDYTLSSIHCYFRFEYTFTLNAYGMLVDFTPDKGTVHRLAVMIPLTSNCDIASLVAIANLFLMSNSNNQSNIGPETIECDIAATPRS